MTLWLNWWLNRYLSRWFYWLTHAESCAERWLLLLCLLGLLAHLERWERTWLRGLLLLSHFEATESRLLLRTWLCLLWSVLLSAHLKSSETWFICILIRQRCLLRCCALLHWKSLPERRTLFGFCRLLWLRLHWKTLSEGCLWSLTLVLAFLHLKTSKTSLGLWLWLCLWLVHLDLVYCLFDLLSLVNLGLEVFSLHRFVDELKDIKKR